LQHYFVSVPKTFVNTFVAQTEPRKDLLHKFYYEKTTQHCVIFAHEKATQNFNGTNKNAKFYFHFTRAFDNCQLLNAEMK